MQNTQIKKPKKYCVLRAFYLSQIHKAESKHTGNRGLFGWYIWLQIMKLLFALCSWPYYLRHTQQQSFVEFAPRDEQGRYLESYARHITYYRSAVASFITALTAIGMAIVSFVFVGLILVEPVKTNAKEEDPSQAASCENPIVTLAVPNINVSCLPGDTFAISAFWSNAGICSNRHDIYFTYQLPNDQYVDMDTSTTGLTVSATPHYSELVEFVPANEIVTCQTAGDYRLTPRTEMPNYSGGNIHVYVGLPTAPSTLQSMFITEYSAGFHWTDHSNNEALFRIQRQANISLTQDCDAYANLTTRNSNLNTLTSSGLTPNTGYCYRVRSENGNGVSDYTTDLKIFTLPAAPNTLAEKTITTWYASSGFNFTNPVGWGQGGIRYYRYVWDTNPTHTWTNTENTWGKTESDCPPFDGNGGSCTSVGNTLPMVASLDSNMWYLHVQSYNYAGASNGSQSVGPFYFDATGPIPPASIIDGAELNDRNWTNVTVGYAGSWSVAIDNYSGLSKYQYAIGTTSGASNIVSWTDNGTDTSVDLGNIILQNGQTYYLSIRAVDMVGNIGTIASSDGIMVDTQAAQLSGISVQPTRTGATVTWNTDEPTTTQIDWGLTEAYGNQTTEAGEYATGHTATLTGLDENTTYHYRVRVIDRAGNVTVGSDRLFTTTKIESTIITNAASEALSPTSVRVTWATNHGATSTVQYGATTTYGQELTNPQLVTAHSQTITGLLPNTTYHYRVISVGYSTATSSDLIFTTDTAEIVEPVPMPVPETVIAVTPTLVSPTPNWSSIQTKPTITGLAKSGQTVLVYIDGALNGRVKATVHASGTGNFAYVPSSDLKSGWHTLYLKAENASGEISAASNPINFNVEPSFVTPYLYQSETSDSTKPILLLKGLALNNSTVLVKLNGRTIDEFMVQNDSSGTANFTYQLSTDGDLAVGQHKITLVARDQNGRLSRATAPIIFTKVASSISSAKGSAVKFEESVTYTVQAGDSLWKIAEKYLGDGRRYGEIVALNLDSYPRLFNQSELIMPGWRLLLPAMRK